MVEQGDLQASPACAPQGQGPPNTPLVDIFIQTGDASLTDGHSVHGRVYYNPQ